MTKEEKFFTYISNTTPVVVYSDMTNTEKEYPIDMNIETFLEINPNISLRFVERIHENLERTNFNRNELIHVGSEGYSWVNYYEDDQYFYKVNESDPMSGAPNIITKFIKIKH